MTERKPLFADIQPEDELLPSEIAAIEAKVNKKVDEELKAAAKAKLEEQLLTKARQKRGIEEPIVPVTIDLAPYCDRITINGTQYMNGVTYNVPHSLACVFREQMQRTWNHQSEIDGKRKDFYQRARNTIFNGATGHTMNGPNVNTTSQILRA